MPEWLMAMDGGVLLWIQDNLRGLLDPVVRAYTHLGDAGMLWIILTVLLLIPRRTRKAGAVSAIALLLSLLCTNVVLKHLVARPRPWLDVAGLIPLVAEHDPNSFPSGHTSPLAGCGLCLVAHAPGKMVAVGSMVLAVLWACRGCMWA